MLKKYKKLEKNIEIITTTFIILLLIGTVVLAGTNVETAPKRLVLAFIGIIMILFMQFAAKKIISSFNKKATQEYEKLLPKGEKFQVEINKEKMEENIKKLSGVEREIFDISKKSDEKIIFFICRQSFGNNGNKLIIRIQKEEGVYERCVCISYTNGWIDYLNNQYYTIKM